MNLNHTTTLYDKDLYSWAKHNAALLRDGRLSEIDIEHIAEELEDMGKSEQRALASHIRNLLLHLLKWKYQPGLRGAGWELSISNSRDAINDILADSPSLQPGFPALMERMYPRARKGARIETGLPDTIFPEECPFSAEQVLTEGFQTDS
jgi:hypothetical protein